MDRHSLYGRSKTYLRNLETDPSQDEFSVSDLGSSFSSVGRDMPAAQRALIYDDFDVRKKQKENCKNFFCGSTNRKLLLLWVTGLLATLILLIIGLTGKYYIADELAFVLITFICKSLHLSHLVR